ncbi:hypothetical protein QNI16_14500 [Cytophagaceae bacterium YF14B1]|uniref:Uncharacterized protein n=1 Tax=Xanthocytophaga flava TaxID=3048013 RepID=A0AAE3QLU7_9BACT|nr:hypothetical protein [Xanthocytophaga flavus]MDJ1481707.1 hypothetical protein [Xanthocytophaga flavus]
MRHILEKFKTKILSWLIGYPGIILLLILLGEVLMRIHPVPVTTLVVLLIGVRLLVFLLTPWINKHFPIWKYIL